MNAGHDFYFPPWTNHIPKLLLGGLVSILVGAPLALWIFASPDFLEAGYAPEQPIKFSHKLHAGELGLDCLYCHQNPEKSFAASVPPLNTCMNCHKHVKTDSPEIKKLTHHFENDIPLPWVRVHRLPDWAFFNHQAHVQSGVSCQECHGPVENMEVLRVHSPVSMGWCLDCHRSVLKEQKTYDGHALNHSPVYLKTWEEVKAKPGSRLVNRGQRGHFDPPTHCSGCHR